MKPRQVIGRRRKCIRAACSAMLGMQQAASGTAQQPGPGRRAPQEGPGPLVPAPYSAPRTPPRSLCAFHCCTGRRAARRPPGSAGEVRRPQQTTPRYLSPTKRTGSGQCNMAPLLVAGTKQAAAERPRHPRNPAGEQIEGLGGTTDLRTFDYMAITRPQLRRGSRGRGAS